MPCIYTIFRVMIAHSFYTLLLFVRRVMSRFRLPIEMLIVENANVLFVNNKVKSPTMGKFKSQIAKYKCTMHSYLFSGLFKTSEKKAWYLLFVHALNYGYSKLSLGGHQVLVYCRIFNHTPLTMAICV